MEPNPWQLRQQVGVGWGDGAPLTPHQSALVAHLFALHGEHYGPPMPLVAGGASINRPPAAATTMQAEGASRTGEPPYGQDMAAGADSEAEDAGERVQAEIYEWLDHHPRPDQAQACGMALTDLMDGRGWCTDLDRELDQVFETLAELERKCAGLKQSAGDVEDALRRSIAQQLHLEETKDAASADRIGRFGAQLLAIDKEQVLPLPLPADLRQREEREEQERVARANARNLLERMNSSSSSSSSLHSLHPPLHHHHHGHGHGHGHHNHRHPSTPTVQDNEAGLAPSPPGQQGVPSPSASASSSSSSSSGGQGEGAECVVS